jgi:hypothetical protein
LTDGELARSVRFTGATCQRLNGPVGIETYTIGRPELSLEPEDRWRDPGVKLTRVVGGELLLRGSGAKSRRARFASLT